MFESYVVVALILNASINVSIMFGIWKLVKLCK